MFDIEDRGQVGIGTLIVFIAMVLVAAIAAGVLINTAGFLQSQAQATGEESASQVSDRVQILSVTGSSESETNLEADEIELIEATIMRSPGSDDIDVTDAVIEVFVEGESETLTYSADASFGDGNAEGDEFITSDIEGGDEVLSSQSDRIGVSFLLSDEDGMAAAYDVIAADDYTTSLEALTEGGSMTIVFTTSSGAVTETTVRAPESITDDETYRL